MRLCVKPETLDRRAQQSTSYKEIERERDKQVNWTATAQCSFAIGPSFIEMHERAKRGRGHCRVKTLLCFYKHDPKCYL